MHRAVRPGVGLLLLTAAAGACTDPAATPVGLSPGGAATVGIRPAPSLMRPAANLPADRRPAFHAGKALAHQPWVKAPTATDARDGLGPVYNARTCLQCHVNGGRSPMPEGDAPLPFTAVVRLSQPDGQPEPTYGDQLQTQSVALSHQLRGKGPRGAGLDGAEPPPEAAVRVRWEARPFTYPDGHTVRLRAPALQIADLGYGPMVAGTLTSLRTAPPIHGVGLLALVPQAAIEALADPQDADGDGVSGRINRVPDVTSGGKALGRFGWKANQPTVRQQVAAALLGDMGIANPVFPRQPCTARQPRCLTAPHGEDALGLEISEALLDRMVDFTRNLAVPARRKAADPQVLAGQALFAQVGCAACHHPRFVTGPSAADPHLAGQPIWPYTDLLLHDLGPGLADGRPDHGATGAEWRTAPLWAVGLGRAVNGSRTLLHDGRARSVEEAILWHGGEAQGARERFAALPKQDRKHLIYFVKSL